MENILDNFIQFLQEQQYKHKNGENCVNFTIPGNIIDADSFFVYYMNDFAEGLYTFYIASIGIYKYAEFQTGRFFQICNKMNQRSPYRTYVLDEKNKKIKCYLRCIVSEEHINEQIMGFVEQNMQYVYSERDLFISEIMGVDIEDTSKEILEDLYTAQKYLSNKNYLQAAETFAGYCDKIPEVAFYVGEMCHLMFDGSRNGEDAAMFYEMAAAKGHAGAEKRIKELNNKKNDN